jgi:uncharacterized Zn-finger protein
MAETRSANTKTVKCPHCGEANNLTDTYADLYGPEEATVTCPHCEEEFRASFHVSISVTARAVTG